MSLSSSDRAPGNEDVIVRRTSDASSRCTLGTLLEPAQFSYATYDEAVACASTYATAFRVRVWQADDDGTFTKVVKDRAAVRTWRQRHHRGTA
jgi:hypothetical protein